MSDPVTSQALMLVSALGYGVASAVIPVLNAEVYLVAAGAMVSRALRLPLVAVFTVGTMIGKGAMYAGASALAERATPTVRAHADRAAALLRRHPVAAWPIVCLSALVGLPPFYAITIAAGVVRLGLIPFVLVGGIGRFVRFMLIISAGGALTGLWQ